MKRSVLHACDRYWRRRLIDQALADSADGMDARLRRHLSQCADCRAAWDEYRRVVARLATHPGRTISDPAGLTQRIVDQARDHASRRRVAIADPIRWGWRQPLWRYAAALCLLAGVWWFSRSGREDGDAAADPRAMMAAESERSEPRIDSILLAADWLVAAQEPDGRWISRRWQAHPAFETALNGLAIVSLVEAFRIDPDPRFLDAAQRGVVRLLAERADDGRMGPRFAATHYNHAPATLALLSMRDVDGTVAVGAAADAALIWIIRRQHQDGGWGYLDDVDHRSNLAMTYWNIRVLRMAQSQGWSGGSDALASAVRWVRTNRQEHHGFAYQRRRATDGADAAGSTVLQAMGVLSMEAAGETAMAERLRPVIDRLLRDAAEPTPETDYYRDYLLSEALMRRPSMDSRQAVAAIQNRLMRGQIADGPLAGSWAPVDPWSGTGGRLYATAMAALSLRL